MLDSFIKLKQAFLWHPKTLAMRRQIGADGMVSLISLWFWANEHRPDGVLKGLDAHAVEMAAGWNGEPEAFVASCLSCGWLERGDDGCFILHDWAENNEFGSRVLSLKERAQKGARARWDKAKAKA